MKDEHIEPLASGARTAEKKRKAATDPRGPAAAKEPQLGGSWCGLALGAARDVTDINGVTGAGRLKLRLFSDVELLHRRWRPLLSFHLMILLPLERSALMNARMLTESQRATRFYTTCRACQGLKSQFTTLILNSFPQRLNSLPVLSEPWLGAAPGPGGVEEKRPRR